MTLPIKPPFAPMEARLVNEPPIGPQWQYEPKWDGFRCLAFRDGDEVYLQSKSGQPLTRYFPDIAAALRQLKAKRFVLDGEIVIPVGQRLSFDELLMRIHPAESRVRKLATEHPALLIAFDLLVDERGTLLIEQPLASRRPRLEQFARKHFKAKPDLRLSPATTQLAAATLVSSGRCAFGWDRRQTVGFGIPFRQARRYGESQTSPHGRLCRRRISLWGGEEGRRLATSGPL